MVRIIAVMIFFFLGLQAFGLESGKDSVSDGRELTVSLITCAPGRDVYELCGHSALRIRGEGMDSVWNYGLFDFSAPHFVYRFVKGETDYKLGGYPFAWFLPEYQQAGREVTEQELNLSRAEASRLLALLREESLPENCVYRYNYVKDNCATRIVERLSQASDRRIIFPDTVKYGTFRNEMRAFHRNYPWYQFGIDLALGSGIDYPLRGREEMFVPVDMKERFAEARFDDGRPLVKAERSLAPDSGHAVDAPTPWYLTPMSVASLIFLLSLVVCFLEARRRRVWRWLYAIWFGICGIAGCVVFFLVFFSEHEAVSPNALLIWLNPLQLFGAVCVLSRRLRLGALAIAWYNIVAVGCMLIVWPFQAQSANPAFFPLMGADVALAAAYAILNYKNEKNSDIGAGGSRHGKRASSGSSRRGGGTSAPRGGNRC